MILPTIHLGLCWMKLQFYLNLNVRHQCPVPFKLLTLFILAWPHPSFKTMTPDGISSTTSLSLCWFLSLQTCSRRWSPWRCSSPWVFTARGRLRLLTDWWEQWGRPPTCATGMLSCVYKTLLCSACAHQWLYRWNYLTINMSVSALVFIKNV